MERLTYTVTCDRKNSGGALSCKDSLTISFPVTVNVIAEGRRVALAGAWTKTKFGDWLCPECSGADMGTAPEAGEGPQ